MPGFWTEVDGLRLHVGGIRARHWVGRFRAGSGPAGRFVGVAAGEANRVGPPPVRPVAVGTGCIGNMVGVGRVPHGASQIAALSRGFTGLITGINAQGVNCCIEVEVIVGGAAGAAWWLRRVRRVPARFGAVNACA